MQITTEDVKDYLGKYAETLAIFSAELSAVEQARNRATKTTAQYTGMPGGGGSSKEDAYIALLDAESKTKGAYKLIGYYRRNLLTMIQSSSLTDIQRTILISRHIALKKWSIIQEEVNLSERQMYRLYNRSLLACADWLSQNPAFARDIQEENGK